jgi:hypothetical protein
MAATVTTSGAAWGGRHFARLTPWLLTALLLLGAAARCRLYLYCPSYWYDEAYLLLNVFQKSATALLGPLNDEQAAPSLFLLLLRGLYVMGGRGEWLLRLPAFAASLLGLVLMVPLARLLVGRRAWLWAVGLCAVCQHAVAHGTQVKPYAGDLLLTEVVLLGAVLLLRPEVGRRGRCGGRVLLLGAAVLGPWLSFPSVFSLGAAGAALPVELCRRRDRALAWTWGALALFLLLSGDSLWYFVARHHQFGYLQHWWRAYFPDVSSPWAALRWAVGYLVQVGHYGATGLGVPLLVLAVPGWVVVWRRSAALLTLLAAPLALAWVAGVARVYPLGDRLLFFAAPCLWLPAAAGASALAKRWRGRWVVPAWAALAAGVLLPGAVRMAKDLVVRPVIVEFREAFAYVQQHRQPGDFVWVSHPQVYEVYHGKPAWLMGAYTPLEDVERAARTGRLWMIFTPQTPGLTLFPEVFARVQSAGGVAVARHEVQGLEIVLYERTTAPWLHAPVTTTSAGAGPKSSVSRRARCSARFSSATTAKTAGPQELWPTPCTPWARRNSTSAATSGHEYRPPWTAANISPERRLKSYRAAPNASMSCSAAAGSSPSSASRHSASVRANPCGPSVRCANAARSAAPCRPPPRTSGTARTTRQSSGKARRAARGASPSADRLPASTSNPPCAKP